MHHRKIQGLREKQQDLHYVLHLNKMVNKEHSTDTFSITQEHVMRLSSPADKLAFKISVQNMR